MNNQKEYDFLRELTAVDDKRISRVARKYPALDKSALKRINALCEEKLKMKENNIVNNPESLEEGKVEVIRNIPWYRRPAFTAAACFVVLAGVTGGVMALFGGKNNDINPVENMPPLSNVETSDAESTSDVTTEAATDTTTTESSAVTTVEPTAETNIAAETTEQSNESIEMPDLVGKSYESSKDEYKDYFQLIAETPEYNDEYESGTIIEQNINAGTNIEKGSIVKVIVSKGSQPENEEPYVDVPDDETVAVITEPPTEPPTETYTELPTEPPIEPPTEPPTEESENDRILAMLKNGELPADADMNGVFDRTDIDIVLYYYAVCLMNPDQSYKESYNISEEVFNNIRDNFDYDNNGLVEASEASILLTYWESLNK